MNPDRLLTELAALRTMVSNQKDTIDRLRAELAESERKHVLRLEGHVRTDSARAEAEAAIARVRELWTTRGLAVPPAILRALDGGE